MLMIIFIFLAALAFIGMIACADHHHADGCGGIFLLLVLSIIGARISFICGNISDTVVIMEQTTVSEIIQYDVDTNNLVYKDESGKISHVEIFIKNVTESGDDFIIETTQRVVENREWLRLNLDRPVIYNLHVPDIDQFKDIMVFEESEE